MKTFFARPQCSLTTLKRRFCIASKSKSESPAKLFNVLRHPAERKKFVMVAMSGGVDSSVSAHLLKQAGHKVEAIYMQNWSEQEERGYCSGEKDWHDASVICSRLEIPLHRVSFIREYWTDVFEEFLDHYESGMTPNPDVVCNREIKFKALLNHVMNNFQPDALATGHYAMVGYDDNTKTYTLGTSADDMKDQTLFLCLVQSQQLAKVMFPVGHLVKDEVRKIAKEAGMHVADKKTSAGLCFVGPRKFQQFIGEYLPKKPGQFFHLESGTYLKQTHHGTHLFTIGQRAKISGMPSPLYVSSRDTVSNTVNVCEGYLHPSLFHDYIYVTQPSWVANMQPSQLSQTSEMKFKYRLRHRQPLQTCTLHVEPGDKLRVTFDKPQRGSAPGQYLAFYSEDGSLCYGGAMIQSRGPSYWDQQRPLPETFAD